MGRGGRGYAKDALAVVLDRVEDDLGRGRRARQAEGATLASAKPRQAPAIDPAYLSDVEGDDLRVFKHSVQLLRQIVGAAPLETFRGAELKPGAAVRSDAEIEAYVRSHTSTLYHPVGTCRMGSDSSAVVDPQLRVRGVSGLRVADASIMPVIPRGNTNAPTIMIAERAAEWVLASA